MKKTRFKQADSYGDFVRKMLRITKCTAIFIFAFAIQVTASSYADNQSLNLDLKDANLKKILQHIEQQSEFSFFYKDDALDQNKRYDVNLSNAKIHKVLDQVLDKEDLTYKINGKVVVILQKDAAQQQQVTVEGTVISQKEEPIPGVSIVVKGTTKGTITNQDGHFEIQAEPGQTLVFSFVGKETKEIVVTESQQDLQLILKSTALGLDEVVVTGVMAETQTKKLGFTVEKIDTAALQNVPATNPGQALTGKVAGLKVSSTSGRPGSDLDIQLRGILLVGHLTAPVLHVAFLVAEPDPLLLAGGLCLGAGALSLWLLPRFKGAFIALQWARRMHGFGAAAPGAGA